MPHLGASLLISDGLTSSAIEEMFKHFSPQVLLLAAFISCIMRKPELDEEDDDYDDADSADYQKTNELLAKDKNIQGKRGYT